MQEALMANPYETNITAAQVNRALNMNFDERQMRMNQLKKRERRMDVDAWVRGFMAGMSTLLPTTPGTLLYTTLLPGTRCESKKISHKIGFGHLLEYS
jgi:trehalose-6-phosphate synthase